MKLNTRSRYAVMALADMANFPQKRPVSLRDISLRQSISLLYLEQIFIRLKKNNIVKSIRGTNGGYVLNKNPNDIKISEIFLALDEKVKTIGCKRESKKGCNGKSTKCITHNLWDELELHINNFFENKKLGDLKKNKIVSSVRGINGGYILNKKASDIKISEVLFAVDEKIKTIGCDKHSKKACNGKSSKCITHNLWDELEIYINNFFEQKSVGDLVKNQKENRI